MRVGVVSPAAGSCRPNERQDGSQPYKPEPPLARRGPLEQRLVDGHVGPPRPRRRVHPEPPLSSPYVRPSHILIGGQVHTRLRSPKALSIRPTVGQTLCSRTARDGIGRPLARIGAVPAVGDHLLQRVRRVREQVVLPVGAALLDLADLLANRDHRVAEAVELLLRLALGRLDHQRAGHRERDRRRVEAVVDDPLGDVLDIDARRRLERPGVEDALVRDQPVRARCTAPRSARSSRFAM